VVVKLPPLRRSDARGYGAGRDVLRIDVAKAAHSANRSHALLEAHKAAILGAASLSAILRTPRIVCRLGAGCDCGGADENSEKKQRSFHGDLPGCVSRLINTAMLALVHGNADPIARRVATSDEQHYVWD
jgi:hypothetical protein